MTWLILIKLVSLKLAIDLAAWRDQVLFSLHKLKEQICRQNVGASLFILKFMKVAFLSICTMEDNL